MAQNSNGDVDRAMASFAASPVPYRNFATSSVMSGGPEQTVNHAPAAELPVEAGQAIAFPLLIAALPEIVQFPTSRAPDTRNTTPPRLANEPKETELARTRAPVMAMAQPPEMSPAGEKTGTAPISPVPVAAGLKFRHPPRTRTLEPYAPTSSVTKNNVTSLATMFRALHTAGPTRDERAEPPSGLQNMLRRL